MKEHNLQVSAALSIGIQTIKKLFEGNTAPPISEEDRDLINRLIHENRKVLKRLGEKDEERK